MRNLFWELRTVTHCSLRGHDHQRQRPTRCVDVWVCTYCGHYQGASIADGSKCRWFRPSMIVPTEERP